MDLNFYWQESQYSWHFVRSLLVMCLTEFSLNGAELSLNSVNSENLRNRWSINWVQYKDLLCYLCLCGLVVSPLSLTQDILGSNPTILFFCFLSLNSQNSVKTFRENSNVLSKRSGFLLALVIFCLKSSFFHGFDSVKPQIPCYMLLLARWSQFSG